MYTMNEIMYAATINEKYGTLLFQEYDSAYMLFLGIVKGSIVSK